MSKIICCPHCNYQYLPGEIFDPRTFIGQPKNIVRNNLGEILGYEGLHMDTTESFECVNCNKEFTVSGKISFVLDIDKEIVKPKATVVRQLSLF